MQSVQNEEPIAIGSVELIRAWKGALPHRAELQSRGGAEAENCGAASAIFEALSHGQPLTVSLAAVPGKRRFDIEPCGIIAEGEWSSPSTENQQSAPAEKSRDR